MLAVLLAALESDTDRQKFIEIYEKYHVQMERTAMRILKEQSDVEDAVQNAFMQLYWMVRSINDYETSIEEPALSAYQDTIEAYIAEEQGKCGNPAVKVELLSIEERMNRSDIGVAAYSIGTVLTADSPQELMQYMAGGAYFDSLLRLHPDGNSARSTMLVINGTPVGFLSWEALDAIESQDISSSEDVMDILSQGKDWFKAI